MSGGVPDPLDDVRFSDFSQDFCRERMSKRRNLILCDLRSVPWLFNEIIILGSMDVVWTNKRKICLDASGERGLRREERKWRETSLPSRKQGAKIRLFQFITRIDGSACIIIILLIVDDGTCVPVCCPVQRWEVHGSSGDSSSSSSSAAPVVTTSGTHPERISIAHRTAAPLEPGDLGYS